MRMTLRTRRLVPLALGLLIGCNTDRPLSPPTSELVRNEGGVANIYASDRCLWDASYWCHGEPTFPWLSYYSSGTTYAGGLEYECDSGCTTYPLGGLIRGIVLNAIQEHISSDPSCAWAKDFLGISFNYNQITYYDSDNNEWGDSHWTYTSNAMNSSIHLWNNTFASTETLAKKLIHEAAHIHWKIDQVNDWEADEWEVHCYQA